MAKYRCTATTYIINTLDGSVVTNDPNDPARIAYEAWVAAGNTPAPFIPQAVTPRQARLALLGAGLLDQVQAAVDAAGGATKITWEYASTFERSEPLIAAIGSSLNLTPAQIDALFVTAVKL